MGKKRRLCDCDDCRYWTRFTARQHLLEVLGSVCGVDGLEVLLKWTLKNNGGKDAAYAVRHDEPFFAVCSLVVSEGRRR